MRLFHNILSLLLAGLLLVMPILLPIMYVALLKSSPDRTMFGYSLEIINGVEFVHPPYKDGDVDGFSDGAFRRTGALVCDQSEQQDMG